MALTQTQVSELYVAIFNRASEGEGNKYWQTNQPDMVTTANVMLDTDAAKEYFGSSLDSDQAFIEHIYKNTLNKTITDDPDGIAYWVEQLGSKTRGEVVVDLINAIDSYKDTTDPKTKAAYDQFTNRVEVSDYTAEKLEKAPDNFKESLSFQSSGDTGLIVTDTATSVHDAERIVDGLAGGNNFILTKEIDNLVLTDAGDTVIGDSSAVLGPDDKIIDSSTTDHDVMNLTVTADTPAFTSLNVEEINVTLNTIGGTIIDADNITGSTITVGAAPEQEAAFTGAATVSNVGSNNIVAGNAITNLTVTDVKDGVIDTGSASYLNADTVKDSNDLNLKINGDVALDITAGAFANLNVDVTKASVLDISNVTQAEFTKGGKITGDNDLTIKADTHTFDGTNTVKEITNEGKGTLTIEFTNSDEDVNLSQVDSDKVIADVAFVKKIEFDGKLDITAKATANTMTLIGPSSDNGGGSEGAIADIHLTKAATTDTFTFNQVTSATIDAQKGGTIAKIENGAVGTASDGTTATKAGVADVTVKTGDDLTLTTVNLTDHALVVDGASEGKKVTITEISAAAVVANAFTGNLTMTQKDADEQIAVLGSKGDNSVTLKATTKIASVITQDGKDTITAANTTGDLKITTNGGDDTVSATAMTTSKAKIDLGAGKDTLTLKNLANGEATVDAGADNDTINISTETAGKMVINGDAGNDIIDVDKANGALDNNADITVNGGDGDDVIYLHSAADSTETITVDGGDGTDIVEVTKEANFTEANGGVGTSLTMTTIENLKIDELATFSNSQLNDQTFKVSSGTSGSDTLTVLVNKSAATDSEQTTNLGNLDFSASTSTAVEYLDIDASKSLGSDKIVGGHNVTNVIDITDADGTATNPVKNTIQLFADSIGNTIDNLQSASTQPDVTTSMLQDPHANEAKVSFDIAVITGFQSSKVDGDNKIISDDSLILGDAATATNFKAIAADDAFNGSAAPDAGVEEYLANAIDAANSQLEAHTELEYVYVYDGHTTTANPVSQDAWLMWDSDGNHKVDAAILLVGVEPTAPDGTGFAASDIIAG